MREAGQRPSRRRRALVVAGFCLIPILVVDVLGYGLVRSLHVNTLAKRLAGRSRSEAGLHVALDEMDLVGDGRLAFRAPLTGFALFTGCRGPAPHYLWAPEEGFVIAVEAGTFRNQGVARGYVVAGQGPSCRASVEELVEILAEDDRKRAEAGVEGRWADINWQD